MASEVSHQDPERKGVGQTAHGVASLRAWESRKPNAIIFDPFAQALGGNWGEGWLQTGFNHKELEREDFISGIALRTKKIDNLLLAELQKGVIKQVCVLGAGLDSRPWRLHLQRPESISSPETNEPVVFSMPSIGNPMSGLDVTWIEVDFPEIFRFKHAILEDGNATLACEYKWIPLDLSLPEWPAQLIGAGFRADIPTIWLLEGFTGYLTEAELTDCFEKIGELSASGSVLVATFIGIDSFKVNFNLHKFRTMDPLGYIAQFGWAGTRYPFDEIGREYGREWVSKTDMFGQYSLVHATLTKLPAASALLETATAVTSS